MKITLSRLRRIIREEFSHSFGKAAYSLRVLKAVSMFTSNATKWKMARPDIASMAMGGNADGVRQELYPNWTDDEFKQLWMEMGQDMSEIGL